MWLSKFRLQIDHSFELIEPIQEEIYFIAECLILRLSPSSKPVFIKYYCNNGYVTNKISSRIFLKKIETSFMGLIYILGKCSGHVILYIWFVYIFNFTNFLNAAHNFISFFFKWPFKDTWILQKSCIGPMKTYFWIRRRFRFSYWVCWFDTGSKYVKTRS